VAEDNGLIHPIGEWVLRESCRQFREWQRQGTAPETLSVNISANQIAATDFLDMIESVLADSGMSGDCLELELTESVLTSVPYVQQTIASLRQIGVRISIDDFGTGITSLGILNSTLVRKLKIDRGFVHGIGYDSAKEMIVRAIIGLARTFKLRVIAEGVETEDQASFLRREGCQEFQGYLYGRAVSAEDFSAFFGPRKPA
jgi:EAL domain-containing protein (putative c-di-GMP-specific phosphodiesterase class I)